MRALVCITHGSCWGHAVDSHCKEMTYQEIKKKRRLIIWCSHLFSLTFFLIWYILITFTYLQAILLFHLAGFWLSLYQHHIYVMFYVFNIVCLYSNILNHEKSYYTIIPFLWNKTGLSSQDCISNFPRLHINIQDMRYTGETMLWLNGQPPVLHRSICLHWITRVISNQAFNKAHKIKTK